MPHSSSTLRANWMAASESPPSWVKLLLPLPISRVSTPSVTAAACAHTTLALGTAQGTRKPVVSSPYRKPKTYLLDLVENGALGRSSAHLVLAFPLPLLDVCVHFIQDRPVPAQENSQVSVALPASMLSCMTPCTVFSACYQYRVAQPPPSPPTSFATCELIFKGSIQLGLVQHALSPNYCHSGALTWP